MYRKVIIGVSSITAIVLAILFVLLNSATMPNERKNGFQRTLLGDTVHTLQQIGTKVPFDKICGLTSDHFFVTVPNPEWLFMVDQGLKKQRLFHLPLKVDEEIISHNIFVDSPWVYILANNLSAMLYTKLESKKMDTIKFLTPAYTRSVRISPNYTIIRGFDTAMKEQIFKKIDNTTGKVVTEASIIRGLNDVGLGSDGMLKYDELTHRLLYIQYYQNTFYCLDTNLAIIYKGKTIDTVKTNSISVRNLEIGGDDYLMPANARVEINSDSYVDNGNLYVISKLIADNEEMSTFRENAVVDMYRVADGKYVRSFYIPYIKGEKVKSILIKKNFLIAIYDTHIGTYRIKT